jgi:hypothetical protein
MNKPSWETCCIKEYENKPQTTGGTQMVKIHQKDSKKRLTSKHFNPSGGRARKINASTAYGTCSEQISPFGGLLGLAKALELFDFEKLFNENFHAPSRETKLGDYAMVMGLVMLMFIGFNRVWHFVYIRLEAMLCGIFRVDKLPASSTYWRYLDSLGINQARSLLRIISRMNHNLIHFLILQFIKPVV